MQGPPSHQAPAPAPRPRRDPRAGRDRGGGSGGHSTSMARGGGHHVPSSTRRRARGHTVSTDIRVHTALRPAHAHTCPHTRPPAGGHQPCSQSPAPLPHKCTRGAHVFTGTHARRRHPQASAHPRVRILARARVHKSLTPAYAFHAFRRGRDQGRRRGSAVLMATAGVRPEPCVPSLTAGKHHTNARIQNTHSRTRLWAST